MAMRSTVPVANQVMAMALMPPEVRQAYLSDPRMGFNEGLMQLGASTAPVQSIGEGAARALTGLLGGWMAGRTRRKYDEASEGYRDTMAKALAAGDLKSAQSILAENPLTADNALSLALIGFKSRAEADAARAEYEGLLPAWNALKGTGAAASGGSTGAASAGTSAYPGLMMAESGGRNVPTGVTKDDGTPGSTAFGPYQFTETRWNDLIARHPDLTWTDPATGQARAFTAADRLVPAAQEAMMPFHRDDDAAALGRALGRPPTEYEIDLAHRVGAAGAAALLTSPSTASADAVLNGVDPRIMESNPRWRGRTVQQLVRDMAVGAASDGSAATQPTSSAGAAAPTEEERTWFQGLPLDVQQGLDIAFHLDPKGTIRMVNERALAAQGQAPETRTINRGDQQGLQEFRNGQWVDVPGSFAPRWQPGAVDPITVWFPLDHPTKAGDRWMYAADDADGLKQAMAEGALKVTAGSEIKSIDEGDKSVTYEIMPDGTRKKIAEAPRWQPGSGGQYKVVEIPGLGQVQLNETTGHLSPMPYGEQGPTAAAKANNQEILKARDLLRSSGLTSEQIRAAAQEFEASGLANPDYNPGVASLARIAAQALQGVEDPDQGAFAELWSGLTSATPAPGAASVTSPKPTTFAAPSAAGTASLPTGPGSRPTGQQIGAAVGASGLRSPEAEPGSSLDQFGSGPTAATGQAPHVLYFRGMPHEVIEVLPDGRVKVRAPTGQIFETTQPLDLGGTR